ncbi:DUF4430 domain-containing protein [Lactobacillus kimbladii]|uniref:DUF4430 domain-containing protein n=1 Tax=Lactobacillus kimbladii TaxID=1218506 RepID=UPI00164F40A2|nr:DUF4430 domain-containing protein [Lactobacillus kimbladii]MBC6342016.1 DUF4430 domain-containing protein [Lactobacillus kimbladii]
MKKSKLSVLTGIATIFTFTFAGYETTQNVQQVDASSKIKVTYTLKVHNKTYKKKTVKLPKHSTVMRGLRKCWKVKSTNGFITSIAGKSQKPSKKIYWTYRINGKFAQKGAAIQKLANKDKVKFTLAKTGF